MYLLSSRCFMYMSRIKHADRKQAKNADENKDVEQLFLTIDNWHEKCLKKFLEYDKKLTDCENSYYEKIKSTIRKIYTSSDTLLE